MKFRLPCLLAVGLLTLAAASVQGRTWTSATDPVRRFEADYVSFKDDVVTVRLKSGTAASFPLSTLSAADQEFVRQRTALATPKKVAAAASPEKPAAPKKPGLDVLGTLQGKLVKAVDGKAKPFAYKEGEEPSHILLYVSAYW